MISLSACQILNQFNNSQCPTYADLEFLDSSIQYVSGKFVNGSRQPSPYLDSWRYYDYDKTERIFVDPPQGMADRIYMIRILPSLDNYLLNNNLGNETERYVYHERFIDKCKNASISANDWIKLITITIHDLRHGCNDSEFIEIEVIPFNKTEIDLTTSPNWQYNKWLSQSKSNCLLLCFEY